MKRKNITELVNDRREHAHHYQCAWVTDDDGEPRFAFHLAIPQHSFERIKTIASRFGQDTMVIHSDKRGQVEDVRPGERLKVHVFPQTYHVAQEILDMVVAQVNISSLHYNLQHINSIINSMDTQTAAEILSDYGLEMTPNTPDIPF